MQKIYPIFKSPHMSRKIFLKISYRYLFLPLMWVLEANHKNLAKIC